jgi:hypothetical protein
VLAAEHLLHFAGVDRLREIVQPATEVVLDRLALFEPVHEHLQILAAALQAVTQRDVLFQAAATLQQLLRGGLVLPEVRLADAGFDATDFLV